jgi:broad specificity phosphatase PhoE
MKKILLIRHAESEENAGVHFEDSYIVRLSELGKKQATELAEILEKPDRIIVSKYLRTQLTAQPLINKHKDVGVHFWIDSHEFQPHDKSKTEKLNKVDKKQFYLDYWATCDPFLRQADGLETFKEVVDRVIGLIKKIQKIENDINYIFTHGMLIKILIFAKDNINLFITDKEEINYVEIMKEFAKFNLIFKSENAEIVDVTGLGESAL